MGDYGKPSSLELRNRRWLLGLPDLCPMSAKRPLSFVIGGNNGVQLVAEPLVERGWRREESLSTDKFTLKWVELKRDIDFGRFQEGKQLLARNPRISFLTSKIKLVESLEAYHKLTRRLSKLDMANFFPLTFKIDDASQRKAFLAHVKENPDGVWICKPTGMNQGKGIYLVPDSKAFVQQLMDEQAASRTGRPPPQMARIIQRYLQRPMLINGRKFDIRCFMLIACNKPALVFYHPGYVRLSVGSYKSDDYSDLSSHLTNQYQQKQRKDYKANKDDTVWSMDALAEYIAQHHQGKDWQVIEDKIKAIMKHTYLSAKSKLDTRFGLFDLLGFDFMLDADLAPWLIEVNVNPALHTSCSACAAVLPGMIREVLDIQLELFEKYQSNKPLWPIQAVKRFQTIYRGR
eukprot:TRINITY_DN9828_c0_g1_i2.p1 TRINITY_DN9828_c0_g1~~TRINITY_DN9828_c0_g1_i2.p1  ORF type:complete len:403 (+),score=85.07 TRINITY_DN9828_c0_g1_i2:1601-2809(+)